MAGARKRRVRGRFYSVLDAVKGVSADTEPRIRECKRRRTERIKRREVVRDLDHGHDGRDQRAAWLEFAVDSSILRHNEIG